ncbi:MAG: ABC transporter ATP-binding protein/permease [Clostridia bacterium]|nr:ABC transporter ATP-binding protein/permease [Clostridia bacterium]MDY3784693.1 ABC transporter ATP-binding protein [Eubacteriales bacterium]
MKKVFSYLKKYWLIAILSPILMIGEVAMDLFQPDLMASIVDDGILGNNMSLIISTGIKMLVFVIIGGFMGVLCAYTATKAARSVGHDLRRDAFKKVMSLSIEQTDKFTTGSLVTRLTNDIAMVEDMISMILRMCIRAPLFFCGGLIFLFGKHYKFSIVVACAMPVLIIALTVILKKATPLFGKVQYRLDKVNSVVQENVGGARVIKAYVREDYENKRFSKANAELRDTNLRVQKLMAFLSPILMIVMNATVIAIIYIGGFEAEARGMRPGSIMAAINYSTQILMSILMVSNMFQYISRAAASAKRVAEILDTEPAIADGKGVIAKESALADTTEKTPLVSFKNVSFRYPNTSGSPVLHDINLDVMRGETVAVIGATGAGKSSLVSLIPRFYDTTDGEVLFDGVPVKQYRLEELRSKIGYIMQKSELFSDTIKGNIRWGKPDATDREVEAAAVIAQADGFIRGFNDGYDTFISEKGASLSGGQKQRISIARALVRHPELLILDDSTSALDLATESKLQTALKSSLDGTTVIMIAQRIASVKNADRIAVIEKGTIIDCAPHDVLMQRCGTYVDIYNSQIGNGGAINE